MHLLSANINWTVLVVFGIAVIALLVFLIRRNQKDKKDMEETMNQVDKKPFDHRTDDETKI